MYNPWMDAIGLAVESGEVVYLRLLKMAWGGCAAGDEGCRMVTEKMTANVAAASVLMAGGSLETVIAGYRSVVGANIVRLLTD